MWSFQGYLVEMLLSFLSTSSLTLNSLHIMENIMVVMTTGIENLVNVIYSTYCGILFLPVC